LAGIGVLPRKIFCASIKGQGIKPGVDFKTSIRENLDDATTVIALISENYYNSAFSMCELGGVWLQAKDFIPILIPPIRFNDMKAVLIGLQALRIEVTGDLDELRDELADRLGIKPLSTPRWNEKRNEFLDLLSSKLRELPNCPIVPRERLEKAETVVNEYKDSLKEAQSENEKLRRIIVKLKKVKDSKVVLSIEREEMETIDVFEALVKTAAKNLSQLYRITCETIFTGQLGEDYYPGSASSDYSWDEATRPLQYKEVEYNSEENGICANQNNPKVRQALNSLYELEAWLSEKAPVEFFEWYSSSNGGLEPDIKDRNFWDAHLW
jgi:hypothetical protein